VLVGPDAQIPEGALVPVLNPGHRDHFRADEPGAVAPALAPEGLDADPRHRGQNKPSRDLDRAEKPAICEVDVHSL
jgi:hypothetical protein